MQDLCTMDLLCCSHFSGHSQSSVGNLLNILIGAADLKGNLIIFSADVLNAMLIRATGQTLQVAYRQSLKSLDLDTTLESIEVLPSGDIAALVYLWNPFTIVACVGLSTSPIENFAIILALYGACKRLVPLAAFGWVIATHLSLYPMILLIPMILLLGYGPDTPRKLLLLRRYGEVEDNSSSDSCQQQEKVINQSELPPVFSWRPVGLFLLWAIMWSAYVLFLCGVSAKQYGDLWEMFERMYGFILTVQDLSPNIGVLWYFFAEVFDFFRNFFLIVFQMNILFLIFPLAIRLKHRPCFLAFVYITISSMLKSYPSVGDSALYFGLLGWFVNELSEMRFSFCLFSVYVGISLLSPVMHNLWIWRGTGNANFYFATAITYACLQIVLVIESVSAMLNHDRKLRKLLNTKIHVDKS
ncbi:uncharacterized protein LOC126619572 isoform X2 [Malus sylvestris]|uniref:uncharacterized protein isoform X2 n=1 Tax=Malus domestica TaxID=3750 RepID=UPI0010AA2D24|nr:phosphatidylinositol glycan anchor biosynthesis class U protein isoform X2 [Malus domestica]XP_050143935.1 uncharacterized protein LOC126619572 isoform X2 [Malus sylvestris]